MTLNESSGRVPHYVYMTATDRATVDNYIIACLKHNWSAEQCADLINNSSALPHWVNADTLRRRVNECNMLNGSHLAFAVDNQEKRHARQYKKRYFTCSERDQIDRMIVKSRREGMTAIDIAEQINADLHISHEVDSIYVQNRVRRMKLKPDEVRNA